MEAIKQVIHSQKFFNHLAGNWPEPAREKFKAVMVEYRELKKAGSLFDERRQA